MVVSKSLLEQAPVSHDSRTDHARQGEAALAFARSQGKHARPKHPNGLVVSSDDEVGRKLAESVAQCGLAPLCASTVAESRMALAGRQVLVVLCNECLADGGYEDIVNLMRGSHKNVPIVVVSRTGEWPEYLRAVDRGAFDYVAYPPMSGDLQRAIRNALVSNGQNSKVAEAI